MEDRSSLMERLYSLIPWPEDLGSFRRRVEEGVGRFRAILRHEWLSHLPGKGRVRVLDAMGGTGVGGVSLSLALREAGAEPELTVLDVRGSALELARRYSREVLGFEAYTVSAGVEGLPEAAGCPYDVIVVYGQSTPHLDPYQFVRAAAGMASCLSGDGVAVIEEGDRVYRILYRVGYKEVLPQDVGPERLIVSYHAGYDPYRGMFRRLIVDHYTGEKAVADVRFWDIAGLAGILWAFFRDVDFQADKSPTSGFILARSPRPVDPGDYLEPPRIAAKGPGWPK